MSRDEFDNLDEEASPWDLPGEGGRDADPSDMPPGLHSDNGDDALDEPLAASAPGDEPLGVHPQADRNPDGDETLGDAGVLDALIDTLAREAAVAASAVGQGEEPLDEPNLDSLTDDRSGEPEPEAMAGDAAPEEDASFDQSDTEALLSAEAPLAEPEPEAEASGGAPEEDESFDQNDIEALLAAEAALTEPEPEAEASAPAPEEDEAFDQSDIEALLAAEAPLAEPEPEAEASGGAPEEDASFDQSDIEAMLSAEAPLAEPEPAAEASGGAPEESAPFDQSDIDALLAADDTPAGPQPEAEVPTPEEDESFDQDDIDALLAAEGVTADAEPPRHDSSVDDVVTLDQSDLDVLIAAEIDKVKAPDTQQAAALAAASLDQGGIDTLLVAEGASGGGQPAGPAAANAMIAASQSDLDALVAAEKPPPGVPPAADPGTDDDIALDQSSIDALLQASLNAPSKHAGGQPEAGVEEEALGKSDIDALISGAGLEDKAAAPAPAGEGVAPADDAPISQSMIDALIATAGDEIKAAEIVSTGHEPPEPASDGLPTQYDLDAMIGGPGPEAESPVAPEEAAQEEARVRRFRRPALSGGQVLKIAASLAAAFLASAGTFTYLYTHQERTLDAPAMARLEAGDLRRAMDTARQLIDMGAYANAIAELDKTLPSVPPGPEREDAEYLRAEAGYKGLTRRSPEEDWNAVHDGLNELLENARSNPRAAEALRWKADLYLRDDIPYAALDLYDEIIAKHGHMPHLERVLMDASGLALKLKKPGAAATYAQRLLDEYPGSPLAGNARLALADAQAASGQTEDAKAVYYRIAQAQPGTRLGALAFARLGKIEYDLGRYDKAIAQLERWLQAATTVEGNEEAYLLLARAYRAAERNEDARSTLNDLIDFFPENELTPAALIELSEVLEDLGRRDEAVRIARQAVQQYPENTDALRNKGRMLAQTGQLREAAETALKAEAAAGGAGPEVLLGAARQFRTAQAMQEAEDTYGRLTREYPQSPQAFEGALELAEVMYESGRVTEAIHQLEDLALVTVEGPRRLPVLLALAGIYDELGLSARAAEIYGQVAAASSEPAVLAKAAIASLDGGAWEQGLVLANRVDVSKVDNTTAYALLTKQGKELMRINPPKAADTMERAHLAYPEERTSAGIRQLMDAYIATNEFDRARALVADLKTRADSKPDDFKRAAVTWADHLYRKRKWREAADAYASILDTVERRDNDTHWAEYQRANALFHLADYKTSAESFEHVAASGAPWAMEAGIKAEQARLALQFPPAPPPREEPQLLSELESV